MAYQVLARQWRPRLFSQMVGQENVLKSLIHALDHNRLHHAYLFTGSRGVGKTSLARIMAKCLNCEVGVSSKPCGVCQTCLEIDQGRSVDLIEIDAASKTKVEDTREILDNVQYAPSKSRFKIYLIDEVHMLSLHSFNALLKTLEEPPSHIKFLLATTEPKKLPITVLSRCLQFSLKNIEPNIISGHLEFILNQEKISFESEALRLIAQAAEGSMRDALSLLDQAISYGEGEVKKDQTESMLGLVDQSFIFNLIKSIAKQDPEETQKVLKNILNNSTDLVLTAQLLAELFFEIAQTQIFPLVPEGRFQAGPVRDLAKLINPELVQLFYQISLKAQVDIPLAPSASVGFEMLVLRLYAFAPLSCQAPPKTTPIYSAIVSPPAGETGPKAERLRDREGVLLAAPLTPLCPTSQGPVGLSLPQGERRNQDGNSPFALSNSNDWASLLSQLNIQGMAKQLASHCAFESFDGFVLKLSIPAQQINFLSENLTSRLEQALSQKMAQPIKLHISKSELNPQSHSHSPASQILNQTPHQIHQQEKEALQKEAEVSLEQDPVALFIQENFGAKLNPNSLKPKT